MAITKRGGSWQASVVVPGGKRLRFSFRDEQGAKVWEKEAELAIAKGLSPVPPARGLHDSGSVPGRTLGDLLVLTQQAKWAALKTDAMFLTGSQVVKELGGDLDVREVDYQRVVAWVWNLRSANLAQATINRRLAALSSMLNVAQEMKWITEKPKIPYGKERKGERRWLHPEEEEAILEKLQGRREWGLCVMAAETGLRLGELLSLRWRNVAHDRVTVVESKNDDSRTVPLTQRARGVMDALPRVGEGPFAGINRFEASRRFRRAAVEAGITDEKVVFHSLRHTCASRLVMAGVDVRRVQVWMGHKSIQSTLVYAHLSSSSLQDAVAQLDRCTQTHYLVRHRHDTCGRISGIVPPRSNNNIA